MDERWHGWDIAFFAHVKYNLCIHALQYQRALHSALSSNIPLFENSKGMIALERQKRVYPVRYDRSKWLNRTLLILTALVIVSGILFRPAEGEFSVKPISEQTPAPLNDTFDETQETVEFSLSPVTWYALQLGAFENGDAAKQSAQAFIRRGAAGYIWKDGRFRVLAAVYPSREDAQTVREQLAGNHAIDSYLYTIKMPAVRLRLSGMKGQIEILQAAFGHVQDLALGLQEIAVALDRQEISSAEVIERLDGIQNQMAIVEQRLRERFAVPVPETVQALIRCLDAFDLLCASLSAQESMAVMGTTLKYHTIDMLWMIQTVYNTLKHT